MDDRIRLGKQVYDIADKFGITQVAVREIIDCYLRYCKDLLVEGNRVDLYGLVSIVPDFEITSYQTTLAYECNRIADVLFMPRHTAYAIVNAFLQDSINSVLEGKVVEIRGIVTIKPLMDESGSFTKVHSSISQSLKLCLDGKDTYVTGFRVHTAKSLKNIIKGGVAV